jgi:hypothetical protein
LTEGIIDTVFNAWESMLSPEHFDHEISQWHQLILSNYKQIRKELKAEIERLSHHGSLDAYHMKKQLLGEKQ